MHTVEASLEGLQQHMRAAGYAVEVGFKSAISSAEQLKHRVEPALFGLGSSNYAFLTFRRRFLTVTHSSGVEFFLGFTPLNSAFGMRVGIPCILAPADGVLVRELVSQVKEYIGTVVVKNAPGSGFGCMGELGRGLSAGEFWHPECPLDDQTFPEVVMLVGEHLGDLRGRVQVDLLSARDRMCYKRECLDIYAKWAKEWQERNRDKASPFFDEFFDCLFELAFDLNRCELVVGLWEDSRLVGFLIGDYSWRDQIDLWGGAVDHAKINLGKALRAFRLWSARRSVRYINLGGSETFSLHRFKTSLGSTVCSQRTIRVFDSSCT